MTLHGPKLTLREQYLDLLSAQAQTSEPPGVVDGILRDPQKWFFWLINKSIGQNAADWAQVLTASGIPGGYGPGVRPEANGFYGVTQQAGAGGVRGRLFLPTAVPDALGYYTRPVDLLEGDANTPNLTWKWRELGGPPYAPVSQQGSVGTTPPPSGGLTEAEVQAMIDDSIEQALASFTGIKFGDKIALRTNSGLLAGIKGGGPTAADAPIEWIGKTGDPHAWESLELVKGE